MVIKIGLIVLRKQDVFIIIFFFLWVCPSRILAQGSAVFDKEKLSNNRLIALFKIDCRSLFLQPKSSIEIFITRNFSLELGACYFWTGQRLKYVDFYQEGMFKSLNGIGPAHGYSFFSTLNYTFKNGCFIGLGYSYRYSHYANKYTETDAGNNAYQYFNQSEIAYCNFIRATIGGQYQIGKSNFFVSPYLSIMIGPTNFSLKIDTLGGTPKYYSIMTPSVNSHKWMTRGMVMIGCNFSFGKFEKRRELIEFNNIP